MENKDVLEWAASYKGEPFHAMLTDPPYELGFMGKAWDASGIAFNPATWKALAAHLHPGAFIMAFASSRGWHRQAVAMEDAGLRMHPSIFSWAFGSGFPKATRIDTQVDKAAGQPGKKSDYIPNGINEVFGENMGGGKTTKPYEAGTLEGKVWSGHRYGGQALKPALEPILVFQKPYEGKPVESITKTGAGALNIDGARISCAAGDKPDFPDGEYGTDTTVGAIRPVKRDADTNPTGRWPANLVLSHSPDCVPVREHLDDCSFTCATGCEWEYYGEGGCTPSCPVRRLGEQSGVRNSGAKKAKQDSYNHPGREFVASLGESVQAYEANEGTAARFFFNADYMAERLEDADPVIYQAKAGRKERDAGLDEMPLSAWQTMGSGIGGQPDQHRANNRNVHPTVKPIALTKHLATLLLPPKEYAPRRILVPFAGVGSEMIGTLQAGWEEIVGIEQDAEYCRIGEARLKYWKDREDAKLL